MAVDLYRRLPGFTVHVVTATTPDGAAFDRTADLPIPRIPLDFSSWGVWDSVRRAAICGSARSARRIGEQRPDVIHCGKCLPEGLLAASLARWTGIPFLTFVHGEELTLAASSRELRRLTRKVLRTAARVIANSHHTRTLLIDHWQVPSEQIVVMHPGVDTTHFTPGAAAWRPAATWGWGSRRVILTVGALQKRKGQQADTPIRALPAIRQRCPDVLYSIAGEGWERPLLENLVAGCGVADLVQFRGMPGDAELVACYQQCDLFALPNRQVGWDFEGFGIVLLEAQACGKPVIAGRSGERRRLSIRRTRARSSRATNRICSPPSPESCSRTKRAASGWAATRVSGSSNTSPGTYLSRRRQIRSATPGSGVDALRRWTDPQTRVGDVAGLSGRRSVGST